MQGKKLLWWFKIFKFNLNKFRKTKKKRSFKFKHDCSRVSAVTFLRSSFLMLIWTVTIRMKEMIIGIGYPCFSSYLLLKCFYNVYFLDKNVFFKPCLPVAFSVQSRSTIRNKNAKIRTLSHNPILFDFGRFYTFSYFYPIVSYEVLCDIRSKSAKINKIVKSKFALKT